jgi:hypothetical protein
MISEYYRFLGLSEGCTLDDLKRAYRLKARSFHPDLNHSPEAPGIFIRATVAYEFLLSYIKLKDRSKANTEHLRQWKEYRRYQTQDRAEYYTRVRYKEFTKSNTYKTTRIFDGTIIIYGLLMSMLVIFIDFYSYSKGMEMATNKEDEPSIIFLILILILGLAFFTFSILHLISFIKISKRNE